MIAYSSIVYCSKSFPCSALVGSLGITLYYPKINPGIKMPPTFETVSMKLNNELIAVRF